MAYVKSFIALILIPLLLGNGSAYSSRSRQDKILKFAVHVSGMGKMDPHYAAGSQDRAFADMVFNGLLRYKPGDAPAIEPDLAVRMPKLTMEGNRQVWTVELRKGVMFHPGPKTPAHELTADDVLFSFAKAADEKRSAYAGEYKGISLEKQDAYTIRFILDDPISSILFFPKITNYNGGFILSKRAVEEMGYEAHQQHPVGTGPFMFQSHVPGKKLCLRAHKEYFRGSPLLDGVDILFVPKTEKRKQGLLDGSLDVIIGSGEKGFTRSLLRHGGIEADAHGPGEVAVIYLNTRIPPMDDIRVRKAIMYALDRKAFLEVYSKNLGGPVFSPVPARFLPGGLTRTGVDQLGLLYEQDLEKAGKLLAEAGYPNGFSLDLVGSEKRVYRHYYRILKELLARIKIECRVDILPHSGMHRVIRNHPRPIVIYAAWRPNADVFLTRFFHSDSILVTGIRPDTNFAHYSGIDHLIEKARLEINPKKQILLWQQAQIKILSDAVAYPVMYAKMLSFRWDSVDYGHPLYSSMALYPQFTEKTRLLKN
ncbi:ABC transporter substrate-binding protein [Desulfospira joergensenii]|uniref:ABC transporter substrate-binding protein n=1 Tax=Desulfospira joergensenii TaxID=53329 RepID=UPI0003B7AA6F|nr:ABC transporter substrate-binding protein [Desulfospira joergensenii]